MPHVHCSRSLKTHILEVLDTLCVCVCVCVCARMHTLDTINWHGMR